MATTVSDLLKHPFMNLPLRDQQRVVALGRFLPAKNLSPALKSKDNPNSINLDLFAQVPWLTYLERKQELFCWTCLLFTPESSRLCKSSHLDLDGVLAIARKHEVREKHMECALRLRIFTSQNFKQPTPVRDKIGHNHAAARNRKILASITDAVCGVVALKQLDGDCGKYANNRISAGDCEKFLRLLKNCHPARTEAFDGALDMLSSNPGIVNQVVDAVTRTVKMAIKNDTRKSTYVSLILSEHGSGDEKSQISSVLRYINKGKACERFIGFNNFVGARSFRELLSNCIRNTLEVYDISDRFLSISVDGKVLSRERLTILLKTMVTQFRYSYFVPWRSHGFGFVLLQTLTTIRECGMFLKMINGMQIFFRNESIFKSFEKHLRQKVPDKYKLPDLTWNLRSNFIPFVCRYRRSLIKFFEGFSNSRKSSNADDIPRATAFRSFLQEFRSVFLLLLFSEIFHECLDEHSNLPVVSDMFTSYKIAHFKKKVGCLKLETIWEAVADEAGYEGADSTLKSAFEDDSTREEYEVLFKTIMRHLYVEIETRIGHFPRLKFCDLFMIFQSNAGDKRSAYRESNETLIDELMIEHGPFFNRTSLQAEMNTIQRNQMFLGQSFYEFLEYLADHNLRDVFPQVFKLAEFVLTLPHLPADGSGATSRLKVIDDFSYVPEATGIPSGEVSVLCIEYELLKTLKGSALFYEEVLARFLEANNTFPFPLVQL